MYEKLAKFYTAMFTYGYIPCSIKEGIIITLHKGGKKSKTDPNLLSVNEKLPVSKFRYFGKYIMLLFGYCYVHVSGQRQANLER